MLDVEENSVIEVSTVISEAESSLTNKLLYQSQSEHMSTHGCLGEVLHNDVWVSRFKMSIGSTNPLSNDFFDNSSIGIAMTEALTNI